MKFTVTIDRDETGAWVAECPAIPGLDVRAERGLPLTIETKQVEVAV
jgi:predicted RNase H-like HicB family nuclease